MQFTTERGIHVEVSGEGPPVLMLHSFWCDSRMWRHQIPALSVHYRVIAMDHRGHGRSAPVRRRYGMQALVDDAFGVLDHLGLRTAVWCGLSIGGMVAMHAALSDPERVQALILLNADAERYPAMLRWRYRLMAGLARILGLRPFIGQVEQAMFGATSFARRSALLAEWRPRFAAADKRSMIHMLGALIRRPPIVSRLPEIHAPALVIGGSEDSAIPIESTRRVTEALHQASMLELAQAGHLCCLERPDAVNDAMLEFLDGIAELRAARSLDHPDAKPFG